MSCIGKASTATHVLSRLGTSSIYNELANQGKFFDILIDASKSEAFYLLKQYFLKRGKQISDYTHRESESTESFDLFSDMMKNGYLAIETPSEQSTIANNLFFWAGRTDKEINNKIKTMEREGYTDDGTEYSVLKTLSELRLNHGSTEEERRFNFVNNLIKLNREEDIVKINHRVGFNQVQKMTSGETMVLNIQPAPKNSSWSRENPSYVTKTFDPATKNAVISTDKRKIKFYGKFQEYDRAVGKVVEKDEAFEFNVGQTVPYGLSRQSIIIKKINEKFIFAEKENGKTMRVGLHDFVRSMKEGQTR